MSVLAEWDSYYVIVGSAAGALIGLQFVVITLVSQRPRPRAAEASRAFSTPTIVHFCAVLALAALLRVPWPSMTDAAGVWGLAGTGGVVYELIVARRMHVQSAYRPDREDWAFHAVLPLVAYAILALSALAASSHIREALFGVGAATLALLFIGIHNAWDAASFHVFASSRDSQHPSSD